MADFAGRGVRLTVRMALLIGAALGMAAGGASPGAAMPGPPCERGTPAPALAGDARLEWERLLEEVAAAMAQSSERRAELIETLKPGKPTAPLGALPDGRQGLIVLQQALLRLQIAEDHLSRLSDRACAVTAERWPRLRETLREDLHQLRVAYRQAGVRLGMARR